MELSCSNITKFLIFQKTETLKISYIFGKSNFLALTLGNSYIFSKESFSRISGNENTEKIPYIISKKYVLIFQKMEILKNSFYFRKRNFLILQKRCIQNPGITRPLYISRKVYSEHWHNGTLLYFEKSIFRALAYLEHERSIFGTLVYLETETYSEHCQTSAMERFAKTN